MEIDKYIKEQMSYLAQNIDEYNIGEKVENLRDRSICEITNKSRNTIEVKIKAKSKKGITSKSWFQMTGNNSFEKNFRKIVK